MQTTSATWKSLWASGSAYLETRVTIADTVYPETTAPVISRALVQDGLSVGNAVSAICSISVRTTNAIPKSATVSVEMRLTNGTTTSEWLPAGSFFISHRETNPVAGLLTLECYDALMKGNAIWEPSSGTWPRPMTAVVAELAGLLGVALDARTNIPTSANYVLEQPDDGSTIHDVLGTIGQACGGNWVITPTNKLRLVPVASASDASSATTNVVDVVGIVSSLGVRTTDTVTGVRDALYDDTYMIGTEDGIVLDVSLVPALAATIANDLIGTTYQSFDLNSAIYDPAVELGDYVRAGANHEITSVLYSERATLGMAFRGNIGAPESGEMSDEYPYIGASAKALQLAKIYTRNEVNNLNESLTQQEVFDRLTGGGVLQGLYMMDGQLYINATYMNTGELNAAGVRITNLTANDISSGLIHSADYKTMPITKIYPSRVLFPKSNVYANNGELVTRGFAIDFSAGQVLGGFYSAQIADLESTASGLESSISGLQSSISGLQSAVSGMQSTVSGLETNVSGLRSTVSGIESNVSSLQSTVSGLDTNVSGLQSTVSGLGTNVSGLQSTVSGLQSMVSGLQSTVSAMLNSLVYPKENPA